MFLCMFRIGFGFCHFFYIYKENRYVADFFEHQALSESSPASFSSQHKVVGVLSSAREHVRPSLLGFHLLDHIGLAAVVVLVVGSLSTYKNVKIYKNK